MSHPPITATPTADRRSGPTHASHERDERGQSTAEYALVMVGVAAIATFVFRWLQGSGLLEEFFGEVFGQLLQR